MDIEQLSKSQILLLTLLVTFVTSIATGIVTVSLMEQAPPSIAQSVNRIVERTVEKVVPSGQTAASVVTREKTVIVKESDLISQAVEKSNPSVVRLYVSNSDAMVFLGLGVVLDQSGTIASDADAIGENADATATLQDGTRVRAFVIGRDRSAGVAFLRTSTSTSEGKAPVWQPATIAVGALHLGQTVITIAGKGATRIADGIITAVTSPVSDQSAASVIETNISGDSIMPGGLLVNTDGEVVGMSTGVSRGTSGGAFIASSALVKNSAPEAKSGAAPAKQ